MKFMSLFTGVGGFDLGFERAGMECVGMCEIDKNARKVLDYHYPQVIKFEDVRHVTKENITEPVDLICGGFPCQDVSVAGRRAGLAGERSGLWFEFHRIIDEIKPQWVVIENVPGLLTSNGGADFETVLSGLVGSGYRIGWRILDSQYFGVAQRRKRVFIVASLGNGRCAQVLFERESGTGNPEPGSEAREAPTPYVIKGAAIGRQPENGPQYGEISADGTCYTLNTSEVHAIAGTLPASGAGTARTGNERNEASLLVVADGFDTRNMKVNPNLSATLQTGSDLNSINPVIFNKQRTDSYQPASVGSTLAARDYKDAGDLVYSFIGKSSASAPSAGAVANLSATLDTDASAKIAGNFGVRRLTPMECERLQGFPDSWTGIPGASDSTRYKQLGNAVTVNVAEWIGKRIMEAAGK